MRRLLLALTLLLLPAAGLPAQETGRIVGRVVDARTGAGLSGVEVRIDGTELRAISGMDGRYLLAEAPVGMVSLRLETLGYGSKVLSGVAVPAGGTIEQNVSLDPQAIALETIEVGAAAERGSVRRALDEQRNANGIVSAIGMEQIARSPDGDAAAAMRRVSGVTVQDGRYVVVRGLGERYTTASLNGARIPSPEPERRVVPLDLFPSGLLQTITTAKTFTPDRAGDFSGALVDIRTRQFPAERTLTFSASLGWNNVLSGRTPPLPPRTGLEWLGFGGGSRALPPTVADAGDFRTTPDQVAINQMVDSFRNAWRGEARAARPNGSLGLSFGGTDPVLGRDVSYLLSGTWSLSQEANLDQVRAAAMAGPGGTTIEADRYEGSTGRESVLWGGLLNASTLLDSRTHVELNATYNRTADNEARTEFGSSENHGGLPLRIDRLRYVERSVWSSQLRATRDLDTRHRADVAFTWSGVTRNEPDRSEIVYAFDSDPATGEPLPPAWFSASNEGAVRTFGELSEYSIEAAGNVERRLGGVGTGHALKVGGLTRLTRRDADNRAYSISSGSLDRAGRELDPEEVFDGRFTSGSQSVFRVTPLGQGGSYSADDRLLAGYAMVELAFGAHARLIGGARIEHSRVDLTAQPTLGNAFVTSPAYTDVLPSLTLTFDLSDAQHLRFSATRTLARPEYREMAGVQYREVLGGDNVFGNPDLRRTLITNLDARWEWYPSAGEVLSLALFGKHFDDPIERVYLATSGTRVVTFLNADGARNYGVELEVRKRLGSWAEALDPWTVFANATVMRSRIRIGSSAASKTHDDRAMVGQAPWVLNAGITWQPEAGATSASLLLNHVGRRIVSAAEAPLPDVYEEARTGLDLSLRLPVAGAVSARLDAKNLLDSPHELTQGTVTRAYDHSGRVFSFGLSWQR